MELRTLIPKHIIRETRQDFPQASLRIVVFVATGGLNREHPWHEHAVRITVYASRCIYRKLSSLPGGELVVTAPAVLLRLRAMGILRDVDFQPKGYVAYQNEAWFESHRAELENPDAELGLVHYDAEVALWTIEPREPGSDG